MGLFDGVKEAFSAPALERTGIDAERETPIDRWMGWSVTKENKNDGTTVQAGTFVFRVGTVPRDLAEYIRKGRVLHVR